jgi:DNA-binding MarR family transcriptional regulator
MARRKSTQPVKAILTAGKRSADAAIDPSDESKLPEPLDQVAGYLLRQAHTAFVTYWQLSFRARNLALTPVQGGILVLISRNNHFTQAALARAMNVEGPTLLQSLDRLEQQGYIARSKRESDRRSHAMEITPEGRAVLKVVLDFIGKRDAALLADLSPGERRTLFKLLSRVVVTSRAAVKELQKSDVSLVRRTASRKAVGGTPPPRTKGKRVS